MPLPKGDALKSCPILAVVGGADGGSKLWERVDKSWHDAQVPLTVHIIEGKGHQWLFNQEKSASLHEWLKGVLPASCRAMRLAARRAGAYRPCPASEDNQPIKVIYTP